MQSLPSRCADFVQALRRSWSEDARQANEEGGPAFAVEKLDGAAMGFEQGPHDFEPEPSAALLAAGREEWLEDLLAIAGRDAPPVVPEDDLAGGSGHGAFNIDARGAMLGGIVEEVRGDDLEDLFRNRDTHREGSFRRDRQRTIDAMRLRQADLRRRVIP